MRSRVQVACRRVRRLIRFSRGGLGIMGHSGLDCEGVGCKLDWSGLNSGMMDVAGFSFDCCSTVLTRFTRFLSKE
jgi:hypothetical protein